MGTWPVPTFLSLGHMAAVLPCFQEVNSLGPVP